MRRSGLGEHPPGEEVVWGRHLGEGGKSVGGLASGACGAMPPPWLVLSRTRVLHYVANYEYDELPHFAEATGVRIDKVRLLIGEKEEHFRGKDGASKVKQIGARLYLTRFT